jgi:hypothetical protein
MKKAVSVIIIALFLIPQSVFATGEYSEVTKPNYIIEYGEYTGEYHYRNTEFGHQIESNDGSTAALASFDPLAEGTTRVNTIGYAIIESHGTTKGKAIYATTSVKTAIYHWNQLYVTGNSSMAVAFFTCNSFASINNGLPGLWEGRTVHTVSDGMTLYTAGTYDMVYAT